VVISETPVRNISKKRNSSDYKQHDVFDSIVKAYQLSKIYGLISIPRPRPRNFSKTTSANPHARWCWGARFPLQYPIMR